ncbi:MAG: ATP-binding protein [Deltaproteobacteria bacterium]|jgi:hypothetical protein|nr:ATP-binding protein [Deltaproteobacteria bacterium]
MTMDLDVFLEANFDSVVSSQNLRSDNLIDIPDIHPYERKFLGRERDRLCRDPQAQSRGFRFTGDGGSGKTHLLGIFRRMAQERGAFFLYVDLSTATDFWSRLIRSTLDSLWESDQNGQTQAAKLISQVVKAAGYKINSGTGIRFTQLSRELLLTNTDKIIYKLHKKYPREVRSCSDILRALFLFTNSDHKLSVNGSNWLLGVPSDLTEWGLKNSPPLPQDLIRGLTWLMSLSGGASVLVIDQIDNVFNQFSQNTFDPAAAAAAFAHDLGFLASGTCRCLTAVSCIYATLIKMNDSAPAQAMARLKTFSNLSPLSSETVIKALVIGRMKPAYDKFGFQPPFAGWPFTEQFFLDNLGATPRQILEACFNYQQACLRAGKILPYPITEELPPLPFQELEDCYQLNFKDTLPAQWQSLEAEDSLWPEALMALAKCFCRENLADLPAGAALEIKPPVRPKKGQTVPLHTLIHYDYFQGQENDRFLSVRALLQTNARAVINRLTLAQEASGLNPGSANNRLTLIRFPDQPLSGKVTTATVREFELAGGRWLNPSEPAIRHLAALAAVIRDCPHQWQSWAKEMKPAQRVPFLKDELDWLLGRNPGGFISAGSSPGDNPAGPSHPPSDPDSPPPAGQANPSSAGPANPSPADPGSHPPAGNPKNLEIIIGHLASRPQEEVILPLADLKQHTMIFGGSGSGKTVLIRRLTEEAALRGVPSLVLDIGNDLVRLGQKWESPPLEWTASGRQRADEYFEKTAVRIFTPGSLTGRGRPVQLSLLPDFANLADEDIPAAAELAASSLAPILGLAEKDNVRRAILQKAAEEAAIRRTSDLKALIAVLENLPPDIIRLSPDRAVRRAQEMADSLKASQVTNPMFKPGPLVTVDRLLAPSGGRTPVNVFSLAALTTLQAQQTFVQQLFMNTFFWAKKNPSDSLGGLLILDEAKEFAPALKSSPAKETIIRAASQIRKYGFGLVLATQEPKSVDNSIISNCSTQFYGRLSSPVTIDAAEKLLGLPGVIARLQTGHFYLRSVCGQENPPVKILTSLGFSCHGTPASQEEILDMAASSSEFD